MRALTAAAADAAGVPFLLNQCSFRSGQCFQFLPELGRDFIRSEARFFRERSLQTEFLFLLSLRKETCVTFTAHAFPRLQVRLTIATSFCSRARVACRTRAAGIFAGSTELLFRAFYQAIRAIQI